MEFQEIVNLLGITPDDKGLPRFVTKKWIELYDQTGGSYNVNKEIRIKTPMLRSDLCDFRDVYIVVKGTITTEQNTNINNDGHNKPFVFKNNAPFISCILKINSVLIDNAEDLDFVMSMYNLIEYKKNYRKTTGSLWNYYRDEPDNDEIRDSKSFKYRTSITGNTPNDSDTITGAEIVITLKHMSDFRKSFKIPLINCEVSLTLIWSKNRVLAHSTVVLTAQGNNPAIINPKDSKFQRTKLYVPVVTLSKENDKKLLEQLKSGLKGTVKWKKYKSQITIQP